LARNRLEIEVAGDVKQLNRDLREVDRAVDSTIGNIRNKAGQASVALAGLAAGGAALTATMLSKAGEMQQFEAQLTAITGSSSAAKAELKRLADFAASTPFELPQVVQAGIRMRSLGADVQRFLPQAGALASVLGRDLPDTATQFSKALKGIPEGLEMIRNAGGSAEVLQKFGAHLDRNGQIMAKSAGDLDRLQSAIEAFVKSKFGDQMALQSATFNGAISNLKDSLGQLMAELGSQLIPAVTDVTKKLSSLIDWFRSLSPAAKGMIADAAMIVAAIGPLILAWQAYSASAATAVIASEGAAVAMGAAGTASTGLAASAGASALALGPVVLAIAAVAAGCAYLISAYSEQVAAEDKVVNSQLKVVKGYNESKQAAIGAADAIRKYGGATKEAAHEAAEAAKRAGLDDVDMHKSIAATMLAIEQAEKDGNKEMAARLEERLKLLRMEQIELSGLRSKKEADRKASEDAAKAQADAAQRAYEAFKTNKSAGTFVNSKEELAALDAVMAGLRKGSREYEELALERVKLARTVAEDERKERLAVAQFEFDLLGTKRKVDKQAQLAILKDVLANYKLTADEKRRYALDIAKMEADIAKEAKDKAKKLHADQIKQAQELADAKIKANEAAQKSNDLDIKGLEDRLKRGEDVVVQLGKEIAERARLAAELIREKAAREALDKKPGEAAAIRKTAEIEANNATRQGVEQIRQLEQERADKNKKIAAESADFDVKIAKTKEEAVTKRFEAEGKGAYAVKTALQERQKLEEEALRRKAEADSIGKDPDEGARIQKQLQLDLLQLAERQTNERAALNAKIDETKAKLDALKKSQSPLDLSGGAKSVADAFASQGDSFKKGSIYADAATKDEAKAAADKVASDAAQKTIEGTSAMQDMRSTREAPSSVPMDAVLGELRRIGNILEKPVKVSFNGSNLKASDDNAFSALNRAPGLGAKK
jgi:hypothetical protein